MSWSAVKVAGSCEALPYQGPIAGPKDSVTYLGDPGPHGLVTGDEILKVNGRPASEITWDEWTNLWGPFREGGVLEGSSTSKVVITVRRNGSIIELTPARSAKDEITLSLAAGTATYRCTSEDHKSWTQLDFYRTGENSAFYRIQGQPWQGIQKGTREEFRIDEGTGSEFHAHVAHEQMVSLTGGYELFIPFPLNHPTGEEVGLSLSTLGIVGDLGARFAVGDSRLSLTTQIGLQNLPWIIVGWRPIGGARLAWGFSVNEEVHLGPFAQFTGRARTSNDTDGSEPLSVSRYDESNTRTRLQIGAGGGIELTLMDRPGAEHTLRATYIREPGHDDPHRDMLILSFGMRYFSLGGSLTD